MPIRKIKHIDDHLVVEHEFSGQPSGVFKMPYAAVPSLEEVPPVLRGYVVQVPQANAEVLLIPDRDDEGRWGYKAYRQGSGDGSESS